MPPGRGTPSVRQAQLERTRRKYRPRRVRVLMVGESPPASGRFFYLGNSGLYRAVRDVFTAVHPPARGRSFLESFCQRGWYLVDLCASPVNQLEPGARRRAHAARVPYLARTVRRLRPHAIVVVVRTIGPCVRHAIRVAGWTGIYREVPYPGRWVEARRAFAAQFRAFLTSDAHESHRGESPKTDRLVAADVTTAVVSTRVRSRAARCG